MNDEAGNQLENSKHIGLSYVLGQDSTSEI